MASNKPPHSAIKHTAAIQMQMLKVLLLKLTRVLKPIR